MDALDWLGLACGAFLALAAFVLVGWGVCQLLDHVSSLWELNESLDGLGSMFETRGM